MEFEFKSFKLLCNNSLLQSWRLRGFCWRYSRRGSRRVLKLDPSRPSTRRWDAEQGLPYYWPHTTVICWLWQTRGVVNAHLNWKTLLKMETWKVQCRALGHWLSWMVNSPPTVLVWYIVFVLFISLFCFCWCLMGQSEFYVEINIKFD